MDKLAILGCRICQPATRIQLKYKGEKLMAISKEKK